MLIPGVTAHRQYGGWTGGSWANYDGSQNGAWTEIADLGSTGENITPGADTINLIRLNDDPLLFLLLYGVAYSALYGRVLKVVDNVIEQIGDRYTIIDTTYSSGSGGYGVGTSSTNRATVFYYYSGAKCKELLIDENDLSITIGPATDLPNDDYSHLSNACFLSSTKLIVADYTDVSTSANTYIDHYTYTEGDPTASPQTQPSFSYQGTVRYNPQNYGRPIMFIPVSTTVVQAPYRGQGSGKYASCRVSVTTGNPTVTQQNNSDLNASAQPTFRICNRQQEGLSTAMWGWCESTTVGIASGGTSAYEISTYAPGYGINPVACQLCAKDGSNEYHLFIHNKYDTVNSRHTGANIRVYSVNTSTAAKNVDVDWQETSIETPGADAINPYGSILDVCRVDDDRALFVTYARAASSADPDYLYGIVISNNE